MRMTSGNNLTCTSTSHYCCHWWLCMKDAAETLCPSGSKCEESSGEPEDCPPGYDTLPHNFGKRCAAEWMKRCWFSKPEAAPITVEFHLFTSAYGAHGVSMPGAPSRRTYQADPGGFNCTSCPAAFFCPGTTKLPTACPEGHYCPEGTESPLQCPPGTYRNVQGGTTLEECFACPPGEYCPSWGSTGELQPCPAGYYCRLGAGTISGATRNLRNTTLGELPPIGKADAAEDPCGGVLPCIHALL